MKRSDRAGDDAVVNISGDAPGRHSMAKFIQICASQNDLFALDQEGGIHQYNFNTKTWAPLALDRSDEGPSRSDRQARGGAPRGRPP
jgi:hypothetical protein